jgi:hypothetical protein
MTSSATRTSISEAWPRGTSVADLLDKVVTLAAWAIIIVGISMLVKILAA